MTSLKYGIVSTSSIAPRFIAAVRESDAGEITAIYSRSLEKAKEKAAEWDIPKAYGIYEELLADGDINIVYISSVNSAHYSMAKKALMAGKHVLCEKPCTVSPKETEELFGLAEEKGLFFMEAQKMLFLPVINEVYRRIKKGDIGRVTMAEFNHSFSAGYNGWLFDPASGGGTLLSSGIYAIQLMLYMFGDITDISGVCTNNEGQAENQYVLSGKTADGVLFSVKNSTFVKLDNCLMIYGESGYIEIPEFWKCRRAVIYKEGKDGEVLEFPCKHEMIYEAVHVKECIENGLLTSPVVTPNITLKGIEALCKVKAAWK